MLLQNVPRLDMTHDDNTIRNKTSQSNTSHTRDVLYHHHLVIQYVPFHNAPRPMSMLEVFMGVRSMLEGLYGCEVNARGSLWVWPIICWVGLGRDCRGRRPGILDAIHLPWILLYYPLGQPWILLPNGSVEKCHGSYYSMGRWIGAMHPTTQWGGG